MQVGRTGGSRILAGTQTSVNALKKTNLQLSKILQKLSTAQRINRASDDAAGLSVSEQLRSSIRGYKMASRNIDDAMAALNISDGAVGRVADILQRQRELTVAARNDTLNNSNRKTLDSEYQALSAEIERIAGNTQYNRQPTSDGTGLGSGTATVQAGPEADDQITLPEINFTSIASTLAGTSLATATDAQTAMNSIDTSLQALNNQRSSVGATINMFSSAANSLSVSMVNTQAAESVLRDQDMAEGMMELTRQQLLRESGTAAFQRFNAISRYQIMGILES